jgi:hypothetical protein
MALIGALVDRAMRNKGMSRTDRQSSTIDDGDTQSTLPS